MVKEFKIGHYYQLKVFGVNGGGWTSEMIDSWNTYPIQKVLELYDRQPRRVKFEQVPAMYYDLIDFKEVNSKDYKPPKMIYDKNGRELQLT